MTPTRLFSLRGRRFVVTAEINEGRRLNAALMKELTGNQKKHNGSQVHE